MRKSLSREDVREDMGGLWDEQAKLDTGFLKSRILNKKLGMALAFRQNRPGRAYISCRTDEQGDDRR